MTQHGNIDRAFLIVCDSMGIGQALDESDYGTSGAATFQHVRQHRPDMSVPTLDSLGIGLITGQLGSVEEIKNPMPSAVCQLAEASRGKDTITGHWEMVGIRTEDPFVTFTETGFPPDLVAELEKRTGRTVIGNKAASGTVILDELGAEASEDPSKMIVYTSADSVLQICGDEEAGGGLEELYRCCEIAREMTLERPDWKVGRVIARPYIRTGNGKFTRTANRRDYTVKPPEKTVLDALSDGGLDVIGIGKIYDIFSGQGITEHMHSSSSEHGMSQVVEIARRDDWRGLCFVNLADFDVKYGHRRDPEGYAGAIERFDALLADLLGELRDTDILFITADHGNDPTFPGSDHTRENVPFIAFSPSMEGAPRLLSTQPTFSVIGGCIADIFELDEYGNSIMPDIM